MHLQCIRLYAYIRMFCCSNETRAPIANLPNSAQLECMPCPSWVCAVVWEHGKRQNRQMYRQSWPIYILPRLCLTWDVMTIHDKLFTSQAFCCNYVELITTQVCVNWLHFRVVSEYNLLHVNLFQLRGVGFIFLLPKRTWREVVQKDCQARNLNRADAMDRGKWKKLLKTGWWSGWWVGECFFWYRLTHPGSHGQRAVKRLLLLLLVIFLYISSSVFISLKDLKCGITDSLQLLATCCSCIDH